MITLYDYQKDLIERVRERMREGARSILITSPTGSGKTVLTAFMLKTAAERGMDSLFVVHRRELVKQTIRTFGDVGVSHSVIANGFNYDGRHRIQIGAIQTLARRTHRIRRPKLILWDESHHVAAGSWAKVHAEFPDAFHIGLTATPERLDGCGLGKWFQEIVHGPKVDWLIKNGFLSKYKLYAPSAINVAEIKTQMGDFKRSDLSTAANKPVITGDAINHYKRLASGKRAVVFCVSVEHSKHVVSQFKANGIPSAHVDGETPTEERDAAIKKFEKGEIKVLSNVELFGEGFDLPSIEVAILLRPTKSLGLYLQQVGRVLRKAPNKETAIILDHAGNCVRHGLPDEERDWSLEGYAAKKSKSEDGLSVKVCPKCFAAQLVVRPDCQYCGHVFEAKPRIVAEVSGDLEEVDLNAIRRMKKVEQGRAQTLEELIEIGKKRGYKKAHAWAKFVFQSRLRKKLGMAA